MTDLYLGDVREQGASSSSQQDNIISGVYRPRERSLVFVQAGEDMLQQRRRAVVEERGGFAVAVELEQLGEQREDESE